MTKRGRDEVTDVDMREAESDPGVGRSRSLGPMPAQQVAEDAAVAARPEPTGHREMRARDAADAARYREAAAAGRLMAELPLDAIDADAMTRDRMVLVQDELDELRRSILDHGLRLPIEVQARGDGGYALISGYRRLRAVRSIRDDLGLQGHETIRAVIRDPEDLGGAIVAMVEENEVRAQLSPYERGRVAVIAVQDGAFENVEAAVAAMFASASKGKRSKIRCFATIHEDLGDLLEHGDRLSERDGLRLAGMLRQGGEARLRAALEDGPAETAEAEWGMIDPVLPEHERALAQSGGPGRAASRRGRRAGDPTVGAETLSNGIRVQRQAIDGGVALRITGRGVDAEIVDALMRQVRYLLETP